MNARSDQLRVLQGMVKSVCTSLSLITVLALKGRAEIGSGDLEREMICYA